MSQQKTPKRVTRNFLGQWRFLGIRHFYKQLTTTRERKVPQGNQEISRFVSLKLLKIAF